MKFTFVFVLLLFITSDGFLYDNIDSTATSSESGLSDKHYINLVDMLLQERREREKYMLQLKQKISDMETKYNPLLRLISNKTSDNLDFQMLQNFTGVLEQNIQSLKEDNQRLQNKYSRDMQEMAIKYERLIQRCNSSENELVVIKQELFSLKNLQAINQLQDIKTLQNDSFVFKQQLTKTNIRIDYVVSSQQSRNQDFLALYNKTVLSVSKIQALEQQVAVTSCAGPSYRNVEANIPMKFGTPVTSYGFNNLSAYQSTGHGVFTCETPGLYHIVLTVMTKNFDSYFNIYKNSVFLDGVYTQDIKDNVYSTGTISVVVYLDANDEIRVKPTGRSFIYYGDLKNT